MREGREPLERPLLDTRPIQSRFTRVDVCCVLAVTLLYGVVGFWHLGSTKTAVTSWTPAEGECVTLRTEEPCDVLYYLPGIAADSQHYSYRVGVNLKVESSTDGKVWNDCGELTDGSVFAWKQYRLDVYKRQVIGQQMRGFIEGGEAFSSLCFMKGYRERAWHKSLGPPFFSERRVHWEHPGKSCEGVLQSHANEGAK